MSKLRSPSEPRIPGGRVDLAESNHAASSKSGAEIVIRRGKNRDADVVVTLGSAPDNPEVAAAGTGDPRDPGRRCWPNSCA
jgi:hypothetical protein